MGRLRPGHYPAIETATEENPHAAESEIALPVVAQHMATERWATATQSLSQRLQPTPLCMPRLCLNGRCYWTSIVAPIHVQTNTDPQDARPCQWPLASSQNARKVVRGLVSAMSYIMTAAVRDFEDALPDICKGFVQTVWWTHNDVLFGVPWLTPRSVTANSLLELQALNVIFKSNVIGGKHIDSIWIPNGQHDSDTTAILDLVRVEYDRESPRRGILYPHPGSEGVAFDVSYRSTANAPPETEPLLQNVKDVMRSVVVSHESLEGFLVYKVLVPARGRDLDNIIQRQNQALRQLNWHPVLAQHPRIGHVIPCLDSPLGIRWSRAPDNTGFLFGIPATLDFAALSRPQF